MASALRQVLRRLEEAAGDPLAVLTVRVVDGAVARAHDQAFSAGGHHAVYPWIPAGEVWIERGPRGRDRTAILVHELVEYALMRWDGLPYEQAHALANAAEEAVRLRAGVADGEAQAAAGSGRRRDN